MKKVIFTKYLFLVVITFYLFAVQCEIKIKQKTCIPQSFGYSSIVCVCNETYCDELEVLGTIPDREYVEIVSSLNGQRFDVSVGRLQWMNNNDFGAIMYGEVSEAEDCEAVKVQAVVQLQVDSSIRYQEIIGFGGAFTDSTGINHDSVSQELQKLIIRSYYDEGGLNYTFGRVPIAGSDFSTHQYSYDDVENDTSLQYFSLALGDLQYKIPFIKQALQFQPSLKLLAAAWSAPKWMKTNHEFAGYGFLKTEFYQLWADYLIKFIEEYQKYNLTIWGLSTQNEPFDGQIPHFPFNCMGWTAEQQRDWIKHNLGPSLIESGLEKTKVIILDDQRSLLNSWSRTILSDPKAASFVSGIGLHWYMDFYPSSILDLAHTDFPSHFLLATEASIGSNPGEHQVLLGSWERGEEYAGSIIDDLNHWVTGWIDWNLVLNLNGGPSWAENYLDAPIIVDSVTNVAYKQPMYYMLGHFSKYIPEGSVRIYHDLKVLDSLNQEMYGFDVLTIQRPDGYIVIVALNKLSRTVTLRIQTNKTSQNHSIQLDCGPRSIKTIISKF